MVEKKKKKKEKERSIEDTLIKLRECFGSDIYCGFLITSSQSLLIEASHKQFKDETLDVDEQPDQSIQEHHSKKSLNYFG